MALETLAEVIVSQKRLTNYGSISTTNDQMTLDIIKFINDRRDQMARAWSWDWLDEEITINLQPGTTGLQSFTLAVNISSVKVLGGSGIGALERITQKEYMKWYYEGNVSGHGPFYFYSGRDAATGARKIKVGNIADGVTGLTGYGKLRLTKFTISDIAAGTNFLPLPDDLVGILKRFIEADIKNVQGKKDEWPLVERLAQDDLKRATAEEVSDAGEEPKSPPPDGFRRKKAYRRSGRTA